MKFLLLLIINLYWFVVPKNKRRKCIFRISCSKYVYHITKEEGLLKGLASFRYRFQNCRADYKLFENHVDGSKMMILPNNHVLEEKEIAQRLINNF